MTSAQITAEDVANWDSLEEIADCFESKKGLKRRDGLSDRDDELVLEIDDGEFMILIESEPSKSASDYQSRTNARRRTNFVATSGYQSFTFTTRKRSFDKHGAIKFQQFSFEKDEIVSGSGKKFSKLEKMNELEYGEPYKIYELYDTRKVVDEFYEEFEDLRTDLIQEVSGIDESRGDLKERFVRVQLDRLLFLYFIQEKGLLDLNQSYLDELHQSAVKSGEDVYESRLKPLFFDALGEGKRRQKLGNVPHLNGGLFSQSPVEGKFPGAKLGGSTEETNNLYKEILDFLGDWNWHVDERLDIVDEKRISPEVLGHIFEQSVNQKEMGAYYTPEEITSFMARNTVHPYILDRLNKKVGESYEDLDEVFGLDSEMDTVRNRAVADGGTIKTGTADSIQTDHVETLYFDILKDVSILDPAVGSGAFLLAVQEVLLDTYLSCIEHFRNLNAFERTGRVQSELERIEKRGNATLFAKYEIILNNLYGVDIDQGAVEICKLRLWLSTVADIENDPANVEPLPNIDFNIRQGNSLIGFTDIVEINDDGDAKLANYGVGIGDSVQQKYEDVIEATEKHRTAQKSEDTERWRAETERRREKHTRALDKKVQQQFYEAGIEDVSEAELESYSPFHWVIEFPTVYRDGGFDVVIGNPPWDRLKPSRDDYFTNHDPEFRTLRGDIKDQRQEELLEDTEIEAGWEEHKEQMKRRATYFNSSPYYDKQESVIGGRTQASENDLSSLFLERVLDIAQDDTYVAQILPGRMFTGSPTKQLRLHLLENTNLNTIIGFENHGIFEAIDNRYKFGITVFKNSGYTEVINGAFQRMDLNCVRNPDDVLFDIPRDILEDFSPSSALFPMIRSDEEVSVIRKLISHPAVSDAGQEWYADPYYALHKTGDSERFFNDPEEGDYPIFTGRNFYQFSYDNTFYDLDDVYQWGVDQDIRPEKSAKRRIREKQVRNLKRAIYEAFDGDRTSGSMKSFVNNLLQRKRGSDLSISDVLLDASEYRIGFRRVSNSTNERTLIASLVPTTGVCDYSFYILRPFEINPTIEDITEEPMHGAYERVFTDQELCVTVGLLNSIPFDYLMRRKIDNSIPMYSFEETQIPHLSSGDEWFEYIWTRSARLNCYGDEFEEMRERLGGIEPATDENERRELQAEIDAGAFCAYGVDEEEAEYVLDDFHTVQNPRMMTENYFELVKKKYRDLQSS